MFVVEGEKVAAELLAVGFPFRAVYVTEAWRSPARVRSECPITVITPEEMARISHFPTPSTVFAVGALPQRELQLGELSRGFTLALDGVQDAGNVGTLLRIADWFAFDRVLLSPDCADVFHQKVINASMGSFARVVTHRIELPVALRDVSGIPVLGCDLGGTPLHDLEPLSSGIVVIGSEGRGLSAGVAACLTQRITIPRLGAAESLNAGVAAGVVCSWVRRSK